MLKIAIEAAPARKPIAALQPSENKDKENIRETSIRVDWQNFEWYFAVSFFKIDFETFPSSNRTTQRG